MDSNKSEDTRDATDIIDPASDQEKTVEVSILERVFLRSPSQEGINFFDNLTYNKLEIVSKLCVLTPDRVH